MPSKSSKNLLLAVCSILVIILIAVAIYSCKKPAPPPPLVLANAIIIEIDPGFSARQVVDKNVAVNFINDDDEHSVIPVTFTGAKGSPCQVDANGRASSGACQIAQAAQGIYVYEYCRDLTSHPGDATCPDPLPREIRVRKDGDADELPNVSASTVFLGLTKYGQINQFVKAGDLIRWAHRDNPGVPREVVFNPTNPCGLPDGQATSSCTIQPELDDNYDYDCEGGGCIDPTVHVRSQNPNPGPP